MPAGGYNWKRAGSKIFFDVRTSILLIILSMKSQLDAIRSTGIHFLKKNSLKEFKCLIIQDHNRQHFQY